MKTKVVTAREEYDPITMKKQLIVEIELVGAEYTGEADVDEVVFVTKPKILKPTYRRETEWK